MKSSLLPGAPVLDSILKGATLIGRVLGNENFEGIPSTSIEASTIESAKIPFNLRTLLDR